MAQPISKLDARGFRDRRVSTLPVVPPIMRGVCAVFDDPEDLSKYVGHNNKGKILVQEEYARYGNQTVAFVAIQMLYLEAHGQLANRHEMAEFLNKGPVFQSYSSALMSDGMRAIDCAIDGILFRHHDKSKRHDAVANRAHIIIGKECYKQTRNLCDDILKPSGVEVTVIDTDEYKNIRKYLKPNTRLVFIELPTNPFLRVPDFARVVSAVRKAAVPVMLDATFASPRNLELFKLNLVPDITVHSATKFLNGHNDVQAGFVWGRRELMLGIDQAKGRRGGQITPDAAYNLFRGLRTFNLRVDKHNENALKVARALASHPLIERLWYPHEKSHPDYRNAKRLLRGGGGVISFKIKTPDHKHAARDVDFFLEQLQCFDISASFGGTSGMVQRVLPTSYSTMPEVQRMDLGITENLVRMSVGIEREGAEYIMDLMRALGRLEVRIKERSKK
jgi:cystathionine gamma-synthase